MYIPTPMSKSNKTSLIILGIDPGYADLGYGIISSQAGKLQYITCDNITSDAKKDLADRLLDIDQQIDRIIRRYKPGLIAIEKIFFFKNQKTVIDVAQSRGVILLRAAKGRIPIIEFTPPQIKQSLTSHGQATKQQVAHMVKILLKLQTLTKKDDAIDGLAIAICAAFHSKELSTN